MENFIKLQKELLQRTDITLIHKLIISYLQSYQSNNNYYYAGIPNMAKELGLSLTAVKDNIKQLEKRGIMFKSQDKKHINATFNNRKAIVLVDDNNPIPTNNTPKKSSNNTSTKSNINTPEVKKEVVIEEEIKEVDKLKQYQENAEEMKNRIDSLPKLTGISDRISKLMN